MAIRRDCVPRAKRVTLCYGVRTAELAAGVPDFEAAGFDVRLSSDDGTVGHHGFVTDLERRARRRLAAKIGSSSAAARSR